VSRLKRIALAKSSSASSLEEVMAIPLFPAVGKRSGSNPSSSSSSSSLSLSWSLACPPPKKLKRGGLPCLLAPPPPLLLLAPLLMPRLLTPLLASLLAVLCVGLPSLFQLPASLFVETPKSQESSKRFLSSGVSVEEAAVTFSRSFFFVVVLVSLPAHEPKEEVLEGVLNGASLLLFAASGGSKSARREAAAEGSHPPCRTHASTCFTRVGPESSPPPTRKKKAGGGRP